MKLLIPLLLLTATNAYATPPVRVAVVDTGLDLKDPRFTSHLCPDGHRDFTGTGLVDTMEHGTHVAGLIQQYAGTANYCLVIIKVIDDTQSDKVRDKAIIEGLDYAGSLTQAVNVSLAGQEFNQGEYDAIKGHPKTLYVAAAGNDHARTMEYPCAYPVPNVTCVGSSTGNYSNFGPWVKYKEPGTDVLSTLPGGRYGVKSGTSMSTAIFTGKLINKYAK